MAKNRLAEKPELRWAVPITDILHIFKYLNKHRFASVARVCQRQLAFLVSSRAWWWTSRIALYPSLQRPSGTLERWTIERRRQLRRPAVSIISPIDEESKMSQTPARLCL